MGKDDSQIKLWQDAIIKRIDQRRLEKGIKPTNLSLMATNNKKTVSDFLKGTKSIQLNTFLSVLNELGMTGGAAIDGVKALNDLFSIPVIGKVSAGTGYAPSGERIGDVEISFNDQGYFAVEVEGDSMEPLYNNGEQLICAKTAFTDFDNYIGRDCVFETVDGRANIKTLAKGTKPNMYTLKSFNQDHGDIVDVNLNWLAPVLWVKKGH